MGQTPLVVCITRSSSQIGGWRRGCVKDSGTSTKIDVGRKGPQINSQQICLGPPPRELQQFLPDSRAPWSLTQRNVTKGEQTKQKAELQKPAHRINRLRRKGEDTEDLLLELHDKEKIYGRGKQQRPPGAYLATNQIFSTE